MTGFDPTAPERDTTEDQPDAVEDNVVPPEEFTPDPSQADLPETPTKADGDRPQD